MPALLATFADMFQTDPLHQAGGSSEVEGSVDPPNPPQTSRLPVKLVSTQQEAGTGADRSSSSSGSSGSSKDCIVIPTRATSSTNSSVTGQSTRNENATASSDFRSRTILKDGGREDKEGVPRNGREEGEKTKGKEELRQAQRQAPQACTVSAPTSQLPCARRGSTAVGARQGKGQGRMHANDCSQLVRASLPYRMFSSCMLTHREYDRLS